MNVFERIDTWLKENHMSRRKLATKAGIPPSSFQSAMERKSKLSDKMLQAIAPIMGTTVDELITTEFETSSGGQLKYTDHPESDFVALKVENLSMADVLNFCRISRSGGVPDTYLRELLKSAIQHYLEYIDLPILEEIAEIIVSHQDTESGE